MLDSTMHGMAERIIAAAGRDRRFTFVKNDLTLGGRQSDGSGWGDLTTNTRISLPNGDKARIDLLAYRQADGSIDLSRGIAGVNATIFGRDGETKKASAYLSAGLPPLELGGEPHWFEDGYAVFIERAGIPTPDDEVKDPSTATLEQFKNNDTRGIAFVEDVLRQCGI